MVSLKLDLRIVAWICFYVAGIYLWESLITGELFIMFVSLGFTVLAIYLWLCKDSLLYVRDN